MSAEKHIAKQREKCNGVSNSKLFFTISLLEIILGNGTENLREMPSATPYPER